MSTSNEDEQKVSGTEPEVSESAGGEYKTSENAKKGVADILAADSEDESLRKYKESLLGAAAAGDVGDPNDPRRIIVTEFRVKFEESENHADIIYNLDTPDGLARLAATGVSIKEGVKYKFVISFRVQHEIVAGLKFVQKLSKMMLSETEEIMIGSYPPASVPHVFEFPRHYYQEAPKGMMFRGRYRALNQFIDSDSVNHLEFQYDINVTKNWE